MESSSNETEYISNEDTLTNLKGIKQQIVSYNKLLKILQY